MNSFSTAELILDEEADVGMPMADRSDAATSPVRERDAEEEAHRKEKSVLQAKLTKLAIQIGYVGKECVPTCSP